MKQSILFVILGTLWMFPILKTSADDERKQPEKATKKVATEKDKSKTIRLFNGKNLDGWSITKFGGQGEVYVRQGQIILEIGNDMTGITLKDLKKLPRTNYEINVEAMRVDGTDFFCGLTFPVKKDPCSLIVGGWGGGVCGLSSIDGMDASENETTSYQPFKKGRWYRIKIHVTDEKIEAWIDDKQIVDQKITGRRISIRPEVELSKPFGIATWQTTAAIRKLNIRKLDVSKVKKSGQRKPIKEIDDLDG